MTVTNSPHDPLFPWLLSIKKAIEEWKSGNFVSAEELDKLLSVCISTFKHHSQFRNDTRFLKIWLLYLEVHEDYDDVYREMEQNKICVDQSLRYEWYALFLEAKGKWEDAHKMYQIGISRNAAPLDRLKVAESLFLDRISEMIHASSQQEIGMDASTETRKSYINPWSSSTIKDLLMNINPQVTKYDGYHRSNKAYHGKVPLSSLKNSSRNKVIDIGGKHYQIKGCAGQGGFAQVFKAYVNSTPNDVVALKIQKPAFPWEFYMYHQLDLRIADQHRSCFGSAQRMHLYSDCSILICDYLSHGTLQDAINSYVVMGKSMEEVLCMYYSIEMLYMLESLHGVGLIHGDFKPDNLLIRYARDELSEEGFADRSGSWHDQGLSLVDWGRGIDLRLFPENTEFMGDCRTSGFRCIEMQEKRPWTFQVDTYGLCVVVHVMLHNSYMEIEKKLSSNGDYIYQPKSSFKRYWNVDLWKKLFTKLLNYRVSNENEEDILRSLRVSFQEYIISTPHLLKKLKELLAKQRVSLCTAY